MTTATTERAGAENSREEGDLSVTALYTSATWAWAGLSHAELLLTREARVVFAITNAAMAIAALVRPRSPSLRWSVRDRHALIDELVAELVAEAGVRDVVELAAGLSRRGAALTEEGAPAPNAPIRVVEVDLPPMVARKEALLARTEPGRRVLQRPHLTRIGADVRDLELATLAPHLSPSGPVCVIAEGLLMYLDADEQRALWARLAAFCVERPGSVLLFDLVPAKEQPAPGVVGRILGWLMARFTEGRGFVRDERGRADLVRELRGAGFAGVDVFEPADRPGVFSGAPRDQRVQTQVVVFRCRGETPAVSTSQR